MKSIKIFDLKIIIIFGLLFWARTGHAAILYSQAANQDVFAGQTFVLDWYLDSEKKSINVVELNLDFSKDTLEVAEVSTGGTLLNLWIQNPSFDNESGKITLTGGVSNGIASDKIPIFRTVFRAKTSGAAYIKLDPTSKILLNDGAGTSEILKFRDEAFNIYPGNFQPLSVRSASHPDQNVWYRNPNVEISFTPKPGFDYSTSFSSNAEIIPDDKVAVIPEKFNYSNLPDGIYYFKVNQKQGGGNWQEASVFRVQIDQTPPEDFTPIIGKEAGKNFLSFSTLDKMSGISHYKVKLGLFDTRETSDFQVFLPKLIIGKKITVSAYDKAGNQKSETINYDGGIPLVAFYGIVGLVLAAIAVAAYKLKPKLSNEKKLV